MRCFIKQSPGISKASKVLFLLQRILGPQDDEELLLAVTDVLAALNKESKDTRTSYLANVFGSVDPDADALIGDLLDAAFECRAELAELLDQDVITCENGQKEQCPPDAPLSNILCNEVHRCFSNFLTSDTLPSGRLSLPAPASNKLTKSDECALAASSLTEPTVTAYANRTEYSLLWETKHADEVVSITSVLNRLQMDLAFERVYSPITTFNSVQMRVVDPIFNGGNTLVAAPTGAGKTNIALWAIICLLHTSRYKCHPVQLAIYVAPLKALVHEVLLQLESSLQRLPKEYVATIYEYTGEESISLNAISSLLHSPQTATTLVILVATPEKLDVLTSKLTGEDFQTIRGRLALIVFDELHLIGDHTRGSVVEELVLRFHRHYKETMLLALSATIPNAQQIADFLQCASSNTLVFDSSYRAVSLQVTICELHYKHTEESYLRTTREGFLYSVLPKQLSKGSILLFTHTRRDAERLAVQLQAKLASTNYSKIYGKRSKNKKLYSLLSTNSAVLFHHAGLTRTDRHLVEELFTEKKVSILVSTATLAWGVNMPAHTVIILGTKVYANSCWEDLSFADILQMAGRAGRLSFDTHGECFIIPSPNDAYRCLTIFTNRFNIESSFLSSHTALEKLSKLIITEAFLSAYVFVDEIVQIAISSLFAVQLFERLPESLNGSQLITDIMNTLLDCCCNVSLLEKKIDDQDPHLSQYHPTLLAQLCIKYYVSPFTIIRSNVVLLQSSIDSIQQALLLVAMSHEYASIFIRADERFELASLEEYAPIKYPPFVTNQELGKICLLLQVYISTGPCYGTTLVAFSSLSLMSDYASIVASAPRVVGCLRELACLLIQNKSHQTLTKLYCMLHSRCWPTVLFVREVLSNPLFKSDFLLPQCIPWIEQLELKHFNPNALRRLTVDQLSQIVVSLNDRSPFDKQQLSRLRTAIVGYPILRGKIVSLCQLDPRHYEVRFHCCLVGSQAILHCSDQIFSLHCAVEAEEKTLKAISLSIHLNEELEVTLRFRATAELWVCYIHLYLEELLFATSSVRIDLVGAGPNKNLLVGVSIKEYSSNEVAAITAQIETTIAVLGRTSHLSSGSNSIFIAGNCLYLQQAEMLNSILSSIRDVSANYKLDTVIVGSISGISKQLAKRSNISYMNTCKAYKEIDKLFTKPTVIIIPSIAELEEPIGYVLELLLMRLIRGDTNLPILIISFSITLVDHSIAALSLFLNSNSKSFVINGPDNLFTQAIPLHAYTVSPSILCDDPNSIHSVYEALHIVNDDPEISMVTPFFLYQILMMCAATGTIYIAGHECVASATPGTHIQYLKSQLHTADGLFMLISEHSQDLYDNGFDYVAENIIATDISQSYLYFSFSVLPGQYLNYRTMVNYHPKPEKKDFLREEDAMLDSLSNWISEELIALEENATTLLRTWKNDNHDVHYNITSFSCLSMVTTQLCIALDIDKQQLTKSSWFLALSQSIHNLTLLSLCTVRVYGNELINYIQYEKALSSQKDLEFEKTILRTLTSMVDGCAESRVYASLVALTSLALRVHESGGQAVLDGSFLSEQLERLLRKESFMNLHM
ncbi:U5 small nuclear ribonucleoprotein 200 kDa helicase, putative [Giardia lamblia P15]|uniref:U5 small nuclear ribonucleoprotein 200 kDa helicase, putative n=1 Tax=Giardia intestinalis (strain P15) TaxID=658858 RepID=E1F7V1_GIAIA|nr:U5 small nuclear ribonucleoprotein 200 kDa helicase, putative [Giardia lamblia P15]